MSWRHLSGVRDVLAPSSVLRAERKGSLAWLACIALLMSKRLFLIRGLYAGLRRGATDAPGVRRINRNLSWIMAHTLGVQGVLTPLLYFCVSLVPLGRKTLTWDGLLQLAFASNGRDVARRWDPSSFAPVDRYRLVP